MRKITLAAAVLLVSLISGAFAAPYFDPYDVFTGKTTVPYETISSVKHGGPILYDDCYIGLGAGSGTAWSRVPDVKLYWDSSDSRFEITSTNAYFDMADVTFYTSDPTNETLTFTGYVPVFGAGWTLADDQFFNIGDEGEGQIFYDESGGNLVHYRGVDFLVEDDTKILFGNDSNGGIEYDEDSTDKILATGSWSYPSQITSTLTTGTSPFAVSSTTVNTNFNADTVDGKDSTDLVLRDGTQALTAAWDAGSYKITAETFESDVATGTPPFTAASTTKVTNLNADAVDGKSSTDFMLLDGTQAMTGAMTAEKIAIGTSAAYFTDFTTGDNIFQIYGNDTSCTGYTDGISSFMYAGGGDGNGAVRPGHFVGYSDSGSTLGELYGADFYAIERDGSDISGNLYAVVGYAEIEETDETDTPDGYITGVMGIYDTNGVNPTVALTTPGGKAAVMGVVKDNANTQPDAAVMAILEGDSTATAAGSYFKGVSLRSTGGGGANYGLDLYDEAGYGNNIIKADLRLESGAVLMENAGAPSDGATGTGDTYAGAGSVLVDTTNADLYVNKGDSDSQNWDKVLVDEVESDVSGTYNPAYTLVVQTIDTPDAAVADLCLDDVAFNTGEGNSSTMLAQPDVARALTVTMSGEATGTVKIYGTDISGAAIDETLTWAASASAQTTTKAFLTVSYVLAEKTGGDDRTFDLGTSDKLGLNTMLSTTAMVAWASYGAAREATFPTCTVSASTLSLNTMDPDTSCDATTFYVGMYV